MRHVKKKVCQPARPTHQTKNKHGTSYSASADLVNGQMNFFSAKECDHVQAKEKIPPTLVDPPPAVPPAKQI
jgi:hypothetical protein